MARIQEFEEVVDLFRSVTETLLGYRAASPRLVVVPRSGSLGFDEAACDFEQAPGEHVGLEERRGCGWALVGWT